MRRPLWPESDAGPGAARPVGPSAGVVPLILFALAAGDPSPAAAGDGRLDAPRRSDPPYGRDAPERRVLQRKGTIELQFSGGFFQNQGDADTGTASADISLAVYTSPRWEAGVRQLFSYSLNDEIEDVWTASTTFFTNYHFRIGDPPRVQPFVGGFFGLANSDVDVVATVGPSVGIKFFVGERTFAVGQYRYEYYIDSLKAGDETDDFTDGNHVLTFGIGILY